MRRAKLVGRLGDESPPGSAVIEPTFNQAHRSRWPEHSGLSKGRSTTGERDARDSWRADGIRLRLSIESPSGVWPDPSGVVRPWTERLGRLRQWSHQRLVAGLDPNVAPLASALLLGRRDGVDPDLNDAFARTGTTHLMAISGLHLQALAMTLWLICRVAGVGRRRTWWVVILASTGYAIVVGLARRSCGRWR